MGVLASHARARARTHTQLIVLVVGAVYACVGVQYYGAEDPVRAALRAYSARALPVATHSWILP